MKSRGNRVNFLLDGWSRGNVASFSFSHLSINYNKIVSRPVFAKRFILSLAPEEPEPKRGSRVLSNSKSTSKRLAKSFSKGKFSYY
jgi:hypothetical protein